MLLWLLKCCSLYKFNDYNWFLKIFKMFPWSKPVNWGAKAKTLPKVSFIFLCLQPLNLDKVKDCFELIMASWLFFSSVVSLKPNWSFSTDRVWSFSELLKIDNRVLRIVPFSQYLQSCLSGFFILNDWEKKWRGAVWFCLNKFSKKSWRGFEEKMKVRGILIV